MRTKAADKEKPKTIEGLIIALNKARFVYRSRFNVEQDAGGLPISRKLV
jgi:hypothetical protein